MANPERRKLVFLFPHYNPSIEFSLETKNCTAQDYKRTLNEHIGRETIIYIKTDKGLCAVFPSSLKEVEKSQEDKREKFLSRIVNQMEQAEEIFIQTAVNFSNN